MTDNDIRYGLIEGKIDDPDTTYNRLSRLIREQGVPEDLDPALWSLRGEHGVSLAHIAAKYSELPRDFEQWDLADESGWTVAHVAACEGRLPPHFERWQLVDVLGRSVAHEAVTVKPLPADFAD